MTGSITVPTTATGTAGVGFLAGVGFDEASGLGSMNAANVANNFASISLAATTTTFTLFAHHRHHPRRVAEPERHRGVPPAAPPPAT